jgi:hypothetical protein
MQYLLNVKDGSAMVFETTHGYDTSALIVPAAYSHRENVSLWIKDNNCSLGDMSLSGFLPNQNGIAINQAIEKALLMFPNADIEMISMSSSCVRFSVRVPNRFYGRGKSMIRRIESLVKTISTNIINLCRNTPGQQVWVDENIGKKFIDKKILRLFARI